MTLQIVMFAFLAVELVGVTAGESKDPKTVLPKAINTVPWRIAVFYVGALIMILSVVPWTEFSPDVSPFVEAFKKMGLGVGAGIVNFVVLTAALSSCNSGMYSTGRMLRDLALNGQGPKFFTKLTRSGTPSSAPPSPPPSCSSASGSTTSGPVTPSPTSSPSPPSPACGPGS